MKNFCTRLATSNRKLQEQGMTLSEEVQGWSLTGSDVADGHSGVLKGDGSNSECCAGHFGQSTWKPQAEGDVYSADRKATPTENTNDEELVQMLPADLQLKPQYHEEELIEVYETHKQVRSKMNEMKKTKGFRSYGDGSRGQRPWKLTGSISAQIEQAKRVSRGEGVICAHILGSHVRTGTVFGTWGHLRTHVGVTSTHKCFLGKDLGATCTHIALMLGSRVTQTIW